MKVIIAGGGTGGHLFPAVALGEELMRERPGIEVMFVGTSAGMEARWLPKSGYRYALFEVHGIRGHSLVERARSAREFVRAIGLARALLQKFPADLVVSAGGYASAPMAVAAFLARVPLVLLEQNAVPGLSNRILWRFARKICVGFSETVSHFSSAKVAVTGNPVRFAFDSKRERREGEPFQILVLGGSTGAHRLNLGVLGAFKIWGNNVINLNVVHQTGEADVEVVRAGYRDLPFKADVIPFIDDIAVALNRADLVVARGGAMTVTEVSLAARAAIYVPYPFHRDHQQEHNARVIEKLGGAIVVKDDAQLAQNLAGELRRLVESPDKLPAMGERARASMYPDAAARVAQICFEVAGEERAAA
ncbi:MAG TPA: undecaprenyldiphospho-muramoylpentapeptide beta-N-acetylglucosaminyltransferase [Candidatus Binataceae bacterium]